MINRAKNTIILCLGDKATIVFIQDDQIRNDGGVAKSL